MAKGENKSSSVPPGTALPLLLTPAEAGELLSVSADHIYRLIEKGVLRAVNIAQQGARSSKIRIAWGDLEAYLVSLGASLERSGLAMTSDEGMDAPTDQDEYVEAARRRKCSEMARALLGEVDDALDHIDGVRSALRDLRRKMEKLAERDQR